MFTTMMNTWTSVGGPIITFGKSTSLTRTILWQTGVCNRNTCWHSVLKTWTVLGSTISRMIDAVSGIDGPHTPNEEIKKMAIQHDRLALML